MDRLFHFKMTLNSNIPLLIDFDGVLKIGDRPAVGIQLFLDFIEKNGIPACVLSNSTLRTGQSIIKFFNSNGVKFNLPAMSAVDATLNFVKNNYRSVSVYASEEIREIFSELITDKNTEAIIVGDLGKNWTYDILNEIFRKVYQGADLVAMQKNKFWKPDGNNLFMDAGAFIASIEYATGKTAKLIGKPSPFFSHSALKILGFQQKSEFIMIGDDIEADISAAQNIGGKGILIYSGKTKFPLTGEQKIKPFAEIQTLSEMKLLYNS